MRGIRVWARLLGLRRAVVEGVRMGVEGEVIVSVRPNWRERDRCGVCRRPSPGYDLGEGRRRWRALDLGTRFAFVEADSSRVTCRRHGVVVCAVPWARHDSRFTRAFEDQVAWLAVNCSKTAVAELMRVAWRTVGGSSNGSPARLRARLICSTGCAGSGSTRSAIARVSDTSPSWSTTTPAGWSGPRRAGTAEPCSRSSTSSAKSAANRSNWCRPTWPPGSPGRVAERVPQAVRCVDPFHVVQLATDALDDVRREVWNEARRQGNLELARELKGARFAVWKNPENLTDRQASKLATIQQTNTRLYRAYLLKEQLRQIYRLPAAAAERLLDGWLKWARRCRLPSFVKLARTITEQREGILAAIRHGLSNARIEQSQHADPADRPTRVRVPLTRSADRTRDAQTRRPLPTATPVTRPTETSGESQKGVSRSRPLAERHAVVAG